jgi:hypothetical protein
MKLLRRITAIALATLTFSSGPAAADTDATLQRATTAFYRVYLETRPSGVPNARTRAKFSPVISHTLGQLLERADAAERHYARVTKKQVPQLVQGDLFTSLFEGAQAFSVQFCTRNTAATTCTVELRYGEAADASATRWSDRVYLLRSAGRWVVDDIEFGGNWQFMHKGRLQEMLRRVIREGTHARP